MSQPIYHLRLWVRDCAVRIVVNDVEIESIAGRVPTYIAPPLNPWLAGRANILTLHLSPPRRPPYPDRLGYGANVIGDVAIFGHGDQVGPTGAAEVVAVIDCRDVLLEHALEPSAKIDTIFSSKGTSFVDLLRASPVLSSKQADVLDYSMRLRDLVAAGRMEALLDEFGPRIVDYARAYARSVDDVMTAFRSQLCELLASKLVLDFERSDVRLVEHCAGRLYRLRRWPDRPLFEGFVGDPREPVALGLEVIVADVGGMMKVVR
ncbi:MAG: hypothetical protein U0359_33225 [Byssovorax sp.]